MSAAGAQQQSSSSSVPGYLPDYRGDQQTNAQRIQETQELNRPFFQSIGGEPIYSGGVASSSSASQPSASSTGANFSFVYPLKKILPQSTNTYVVNSQCSSSKKPICQVYNTYQKYFKHS